MSRAPAAPPSAPALTALDEAPALIAKLAQRERALESMQMRAVMEYESGDRKIKTREEITVVRPDSLRVDAFSALGVGLVVAARGHDLQIFDPSANKFIRGAATAETLHRFARIPLAPRDAVGLLMGLVPDVAALPPPTSVVRSDGMVVVRFSPPDSQHREIGFRDGNLALVIVGGVGGEPNYRVRYNDYRDIGGIMLAYQMDAEFPAERTTVKFRFERPIINGNLAASMFELIPGPGAEVVNLEPTAAAAAASNL